LASHRTDHSAEAYRGPPFGTSRALGGQQHRTLLHSAAKTFTGRTSHSLIGTALSLHTLLQARGIVQVLGLRRTVQPTIIVNKFRSIYVILRVCSEQSYRIPHFNNIFFDSAKHLATYLQATISTD